VNAGKYTSHSSLSLSPYFFVRLSVGKTSIIQNYIRKTVLDGYKPTIGADFFSKHVEV